MRRQIVLAIVGSWMLTVAGPGYAQAAAPAEAAASPQIVSLSGCPVQGIEPGCLMILKKGQAYDISAAPAQVDPKQLGALPAPPKVGYFAIKASGTATPGKAGRCARATPVEKITWNYTRLKCLKPL